MKKLLLLLFLCGLAQAQNSFSGGTISGNVLPDATGRDLGSASKRWDIYAQYFDLSGAFTGTPILTGGTINGSVIGGITPAAGSFTTLSASGATTTAGIADSGVSTFQSLNSIKFAGPGATPTIDQAVASCGTNPCTVYISQSYTGAESVNLETSSTGYKIYTGGPTVTVVDLRQNVATPANPSAAPIYSQTLGGRTGGSLNDFSANLWTGGTIPDSTSAGYFGNWISGTLPASGDQFGLTAFAQTHDSLTVGASPVRVAAIDAEVLVNNITNDAPLPDVRAVTAKVHSTRANAAQNVTTATAFEAQTCSYDAAGAGRFTNCYGFRAEPQANATTRNYGFYNQANWLSDNDKYFDVLDSSGAVQHAIFYRANNTTEYRPLADASGWSWLTQGGTQLFAITSSNIVNKVTAQFVGGANPLTAAGANLGNTTYPWAGLYIGTSAPSVTASIVGSTGAATFATVTIGGGAAIAWFQKATHASLDLASVNTGACTAAQTETISSAALGDSCNVSAGTALEDGGFFRCAVTAANTAKWQFCNLSGGAIDRASDTYTIRVLR